MDIVKHNSIAWDNQVRLNNKWTIPVSIEEIAKAIKGNADFLLTPTKPVPLEWYNCVKGKKVLCLASGGGQQGPLFAALGADVTVFDMSAKQLEQDKYVAKRDNLNIITKQGNMKDLSHFNDESFDLIFHPVSNCFVDEIQPVWNECYRVLKKGGCLLAGFVNPVKYIFDLDEWDKNSNLIVKNKIPYSDVEQLPKNQLQELISNYDALEYGHSLQSQIGGQINAGFVIAGFYEDNAGGDLLDNYINTFIATKAVKIK